MAVQIMRSGVGSQRISHNEKVQARREARQGQNNSKQLKKGTINMSELSGRSDTILKRKQLAKKRAMKVVSDAWAGDKKIDADIEDRRAHIQELRAGMSENMDIVKGCEARKAELKETYGVTDDSQEQKDLELLELWNQHAGAAIMSKELESKEVWEELSNVSLTEEEWQRMIELDGKPYTEYQQRALELDKSISHYQGNVNEAQKEILGENASIRATRLERLKYHGMVDAQKEADEINAAASKEAIGMLIGEAKDHIEETLKEQQEAAKKKAEEKEEQEEKLEEQKEEKEELQAQLELQREETREAEEIRAEQRKAAREQADLLEAAEANYTGAESLPSQVQAEIKGMLQKMKLLDEDLKGAKVDDKA